MVIVAAIVAAAAVQVSPISWLSLLEALSAIVTIGGGLIFILRQGKTQRKRNDRFDRDWYGEPERPGVPARPGVLEQLLTVRTEVGEIRAEVFPNHGGSIKDAVDRIDIRVKTVETDVKGLHDRLDGQTGVNVNVHT